MTLTEYFDPYNIDHIKAYRHLEKYGFWPEDFIPEDIEIENNWQISLLNKMAKAWIHYMI